MCKHILNAQVSIRASCCKKWFDCPQCHAETQDHELARDHEIIMACKKCKKVFRKSPEQCDESDEYCPNCDNHYVIEAKTPESTGTLVVEYEGTADMIRDERQAARAPTLL
eukprot:gnl/Hemi2/18363_TR6094_c0_g1_i1.p1 gnl/Hemi2/18363_TR6094_c0_g1~~gnl/Hemi2/18363_TR6094_c0_g1_i1.p1  ORF type:complete len:111 (-),score=39.87 gnl/Hemi2/18363_TR6094_c0_g1_i1:163-495(-)